MYNEERRFNTALLEIMQKWRMSHHITFSIYLVGEKWAVKVDCVSWDRKHLDAALCVQIVNDDFSHHGKSQRSEKGNWKIENNQKDGDVSHLHVEFKIEK